MMTVPIGFAVAFIFALLGVLVPTLSSIFGEVGSIAGFAIWLVISAIIVYFFVYPM